MKILLLKQGVKDQATLDKGIEIAKQYGATIGLDLEFQQVETTKQFTSITIKASSTSVNGYAVNGAEVLQEGKLKGVADIYLLVYDWTKITPQPTNPSEMGMAMSIPIQWYVTFPEVFAEFFFHELSHYFLQKSGTLDITHTYDPRYSQLQRKDWYLFLIKPFIKQTPMPTQKYKYFKPSEIIGLKSELVTLLDQARGIANIPFKINSGFRTIEQNIVVGGVLNSAHLTGEAVDISCVDSINRMKIIKALLQVGFNRIETANAHIHCDISKTLPQGVFILSEKD